mgnify:CR=1 FL=1
MLLAIFFIIGTAIFRGSLNYIIINAILSIGSISGIYMSNSLLLIISCYGKVGYYPFFSVLSMLFYNTSYLFILFDLINKRAYFSSFTLYQVLLGCVLSFVCITKISECQILDAVLCIVRNSFCMNQQIREIYFVKSARKLRMIDGQIRTVNGHLLFLHRFQLKKGILLIMNKNYRQSFYTNQVCSMWGSFWFSQYAPTDCNRLSK